MATRLLHALLASLLTLAPLVLGACNSLSGDRPTTETARLRRILDSGELRVGISADLPPLSMKDKQGHIIGFEADLIRALAHSMGLEVRFVERAFPDLLDALQGDDVDVVIAGMTITPERNARVAFAGPYFISGTSILTRDEEIAEVGDPTLLDDSSRTFAALGGSTSAQFVRDILPNAKLVTTPDYETAVQMVIDGDADALIADYLTCRLAVWRHEGEGLTALMTPFTVEPLGIALPPDAPLLLNLVENYLNTLESTGLLNQFKARWLADGSWLSQLP